jgi:hypothetical protein
MMGLCFGLCLLGLGAFVLSWGVSIFLENATKSSTLGGYGFFGGYALGVFGGGFIGLLLARRVKI